MTLLELLVKELPKRGGWPEDFTFAVQDVNGDVKFGLIQNVIFYNSLTWLCKRGYDAEDIWGDNKTPEMRNAVLTEDYNKSIVNREQYEAAIAAQQPAWNGEGLPPIGLLVELMDDSQSQTWGNVTIKYYGDSFAVWDDHGEECANSLCHVKVRPILTEAERKRDAAGLAIYNAINWNAEGEMVSTSRMEDYRKAYDAIAAGKIPGVKMIED